VASDARPARGVLRPSFPCSGADLVAARTCEQVVFGRHFRNTPEELAVEYGPYEPTTAFGGIFAADGTALGAVRLVRPGELPLKTLVDAGAPPWSLSPRAIEEVTGVDVAATWDVASFGVDTVAAGADPRIAVALLSVLFGAFRDNAVVGFVAILDSAARRPLSGLGVRVLDLPGARPEPYLGSGRSVPVHRRVADLHLEHERSTPSMHPQVFHGRGIEGLDERLVSPGCFALPGS
jgi:hypothetical protein